MPHVRFKDTVEEIAGGNWGMDFLSEEEACKKMLESGDLAGYCAMALMERFDGVIGGISHYHMEKLQKKINKFIHRCIDIRISECSAKGRGKPPSSYIDFIKERAHSAVGYWFLYGKLGNYPQLWLHALPKRGTAERREYDAWIRKSVRKEKKKPDKPKE